MSHAGRLGSKHRRTRQLTRVALGAALLTVAAPAFAAEPAPALPLVLTYEASAGCPDQPSFRSQVELRSQRPITWLPEGDARRATIRIEERAEGVRGSLELALANHERTRREVFANTCAEVASGLALVVALAIDEEAARPEPVRAAVPELAPRAPSDPLSAPPPARIRPRLELQAGPAFGAVYGPAPVALVTLGATLAARYDTWTWLSPTFYLTPLYAKTGVSGPATPLASFTWTTVLLEACPALARLASSVRVIGCAASHLGQTIVEGSPEVVPFPTREHRFWADLGLSVKLELRWRSWFTDLSAAGLVTLTRDEYVFTEPAASVHQVPNLAYSGLFALGVRL